MTRGLPADFASERPDAKPLTNPVATVAATPGLTDEQRLDARRAVAYRAKEDGWTTAESRQALEMLGLLPEHASGPSSVGCPTCGAAAGAVCRTTGSRSRALAGGWHRTRKAAAL